MSNKSNLDNFEASMKRARLGRSTIFSYLSVAKHYISFCRGRSFCNPQDAVSSYLSTFAEDGKSAAYQNQALNALAGKNGLYAALGNRLPELPSWVKARRPETVPAWVTQSEAEKIIANMEEPWAMLTGLMFGSGLRVSEVTSLRWRDIDFERLSITVKQSKGKKDRITFLPRSLVDSLRIQERRCRLIWNEDRERGRCGVQVPSAVSNKSPRAGEQWAFFWVFPAAGESHCPESRIRRRHHLHQKSFARPLRRAVSRAGVAKRVTAHAFRHGFATAYLLAGGVITELRDLLGHKSIETTEIYTHCMPSFRDRVGSPLDQRGNVVAVDFAGGVGEVESAAGG